MIDYRTLPIGATLSVHSSGSDRVGPEGLRSTGVVRTRLPFRLAFAAYSSPASPAQESRRSRHGSQRSPADSTPRSTRSITLPGWAPRENFLQDVNRFTSEDAWTAEWQYPSARALLARRADLLAWLDLATLKGRRNSVNASNERARLSVKFPPSDPVQVMLEAQRDARPDLASRSLGAPSSSPDYQS